MSTPAEIRAEAAALLTRATKLETQLTRADLANMSPELIEAARVDGRLDTLLCNVDTK